MLNWNFYPRNLKAPEHLIELLEIFNDCHLRYDSEHHEHNSNSVLKILEEPLTLKGYKVERSKKGHDKISVPVLYGLNGRVTKHFDADALDCQTGTVLEIEAGRAVTNYQFLKDLFQSCMMIDVKYLVIAVRNIYRGNKDFETVSLFFDTLYSSERLKLPLTGILIIGY